jgi:hypothetical protein
MGQISKTLAVGSLIATVAGLPACSSKDGGAKNDVADKNSGCPSDYVALDSSHDIGASKPLECITLAYTERGSFLISLTDKNPEVWPRVHFAVSEYADADKRVKSGKLYTNLGSMLLTPTGEKKIPEVTDASVNLETISFNEGGRSVGTLIFKQSERVTTIKFDGVTRKSE